MLLAIPAGKASCLLLRHKNWSQQITGLTPDKSTPLETPETNDVISTKRERCLNTTHWTQLPELLRTKHPKVHVHFKGVDAPALHDRLIGQERACCSPSARSSPHADAPRRKTQSGNSPAPGCAAASQLGSGQLGCCPRAGGGRCRYQRAPKPRWLVPSGPGPRPGPRRPPHTSAVMHRRG